MRRLTKIFLDDITDEFFKGISKKKEEPHPDRANRIPTPSQEDGENGTSVSDENQAENRGEDQKAEAAPNITGFGNSHQNKINRDSGSGAAYFSSETDKLLSSRLDHKPHFSSQQAQTSSGKRMGGGADASLPWQRNRTAASRKRILALRKWRKRFSIIALICFLILTSGTGFWIWKTGRLDVARFQAKNSADSSIAQLGLILESVQINGNYDFTKISQIRDSIRANQGDSIFKVQPSQLRKRLLSLPWVKEAVVERRLPMTLVLTLEEHKPLAIWQLRNEEYLLDERGQKIKVDNLDAFRNLPVVIGKTANQMAPEFVLMLKQVPDILTKLEGAYFVNQRRWTLKLKNGILLHLPEKDPLLALKQVSALDQKDSLLSRDILEIDLRLKDRMVIRVRPNSESKTEFQPDPGRNSGSNI